MKRLNLANRLLLHAALAVLMAALMVLPDHLFVWLQPNYPVRFYPNAFAAGWLLGVMLLALRHQVTAVLFIGFVGLMQLSQFLHFAYFGTLISPHEVVFLFEEWGEIWLTLAAVAPYMAGPLALVAVAGGLTYLVWMKSRPAAVRLPLAGLLLLLILAYQPYRAYVQPKSQSFYPSPSAYSLRNTWTVTAYYIGHSLRGEDKPERASFQPYRVEKLPIGELPTVVVVMGESLTYKHMSLFGYERPTTPGLDRLKSDPQFVYLRAIAGGVSTKVSLPTFFNIQREPGNIGHLIRYETNLLKLAKERGMATHFISAQTPNLMTYSGTEYVDHYLTKEDVPEQYERLKDDMLLEQLDAIDLSRPAFIVLHQRNSHSPYEQSYPARFEKYPVRTSDRDSYTRNTYDNSVGYTDYLLTAILQRIQQKTRRSAYLVFTADHGEMMGEGGKYGHTLLEEDVLRVPFLFYGVGPATRAEVARVRAMQAPTHYEIGKLVAGLMGYRIINPNERDGLFYGNGPDLDGSMGCLPLVKDAAVPQGWRLVDDPLCPRDARK
ncbi:MAG: phosphoethanolamine transferase [Gallionellaceae bacterium]|nr:phosphoethanolamine transferase [Gallionellaceae bacterium]